jgi:hypothetical protein
MEEKVYRNMLGFNAAELSKEKTVGILQNMLGYEMEQKCINVNCIPLQPFVSFLEYFKQKCVKYKVFSSMYLK